jgi:hypothetical protein
MPVVVTTEVGFVVIVVMVVATFELVYAVVGGAPKSLETPSRNPEFA